MAHRHGFALMKGLVTAAVLAALASVTFKSHKSETLSISWEA